MKMYFRCLMIALVLTAGMVAGCGPERPIAPAAQRSEVDITSAETPVNVAAVRAPSAEPAGGSLIAQCY